MSTLFFFFFFFGLFDYWYALIVLNFLFFWFCLNVLMMGCF